MLRSLCSWSSLAYLAFACSAWAQYLDIEEVAVSDYEGGLGLPASFEFTAGQKVYLSFRIAGMGQADAKAALRYEVNYVDCEGRQVIPTMAANLRRTMSGRPWNPVVRGAVEIPSAPRSGTHSFRIAVTDEVTKQTVYTSVPFEVRSDFEDPAETLSIVRFRFFRSDYSDTPLPVRPEFQRGNEIWGRFYLTGFRLNEKNEYNLQYGVSLRDTLGRIIFNEPAAASETKSFFYAKTHVPGVINVSLERSIKPGAYLLVISASDVIGNQKTAAEFPFRVGE